MKTLLKFIVYGLIAFILITGFAINSHEFIPDNAKIYIIEDNQIWMPRNAWTDEIFIEQAEFNSEVRKAYDDRIEATYYEVKKGKYKGYELPVEWKSDKSRIVNGKSESLLRSWVFPKPDRWNSEGNWNY